jgi:hypothetical protein
MLWVFYALINFSFFFQSSYVNQLYTTSHDYGEERDREAFDEKRKARARAIVENLRVAEYDAGEGSGDE